MPGQEREEVGNMSRMRTFRLMEKQLQWARKRLRALKKKYIKLGLLFINSHVIVVYWVKLE